MTKPWAASVFTLLGGVLPNETGSHFERTTLELRSASISRGLTTLRSRQRSQNWVLIWVSSAMTETAKRIVLASPMPTGLAQRADIGARLRLGELHGAH